MLPVPSNPNRDPRALINTIENGNLAKVQELLPSADHLKNFQTTDEKTGDSLIHLAVRSSNNDILEFLLKKIRLDPNLTNSNKDNPLHLAVENNDKKAVEILLETGAAFWVYGKHGNTPLHLAVRNDNYEISKILIDQKADLDSRNGAENTPFHLAALNKSRFPDSKIYDLLLKKEAKDLPNKNGVTPSSIKQNGVDKELVNVSKAKEGGASRGTGPDRRVNYSTVSHPSSLRNLSNGKFSDANVSAIEKRIKELSEYALNSELTEIDHEGKTALINACRNGSPGIAELLLKAGANIETRSKKMPDYYIEQGLTPILAGAFNGNPAIAELLIKYGADVNDAETLEGWTAGIICTIDWPTSGKKENPEFLEVLLKNKADVNSKDIDDMTILMSACAFGVAGSVETLLKAGANVNDITRNEYDRHPNYSALHFAVHKSNLLLKENAQEDNSSIIKLLLEKNANTELKTKHDEIEYTALTLAAKEGNYKAVKLLYDNGAKIPESSAEEIIKGLDFLETEEEKSKSLQVRIKLMDDKRDERLKNDRIESIKNGEELGPNNTFTNDIKFKAITSISDKIKSGDIKADSVSKINPLYRKLIKLKEIGVENKDVANINDKIIKAVLENPEEFKTLFETASKINKVEFGDDNNLIVKADSDQERYKILYDLKLVLDPSSNLKLNKQSFYGGVEKLEKTLSAEFMKALGGKDNAKKLIDNFLDEKPSPSSSPREGTVKASQLMKTPPNRAYTPTNFINS